MWTTNTPPTTVLTHRLETMILKWEVIISQVKPTALFCSAIKEKCEVGQGNIQLLESCINIQYKVLEKSYTW